MPIRSNDGRRARSPRPGLSGRAVGLAAACGVALAVVVWLVVIPPTYQAWAGEIPVAVGREIPALASAMQEWANAQGTRVLTLEIEGNRWDFKLSDLGFAMPDREFESALRQARDSLLPWERLPWHQPRLQVEAPPVWDRERLDTALAPLRAALSKEPVPARLEIREHLPVITPEVPGTAVETDFVLAALKRLGPTSTLEIPLAHPLPSVTAESLQQLRIRRLLAAWTTNYDPTIPRADNVAKAAQVFNGLMLKPGEILSYNAAVGPIDSANGWKEAYVIVAGELVPGVGGGVCQVATTLYGAALRANLEIMERHPHQLALSYIPASQDAAITPGFEDLKLRNTTPGHILIETETGGGSVTFRIYGDAPENLQVRIDSKVIGTQPFPTRVITDPRQPRGTRELRSRGSNGVTSEGYRLVYRDGTLVKRELLSRDTYQPTTEVVVAGLSR